VAYKLALIGEAWGEAEEKQRLPFVGASGWLLNTMLEDAGIERHECFISNVFNLRPARNDILNLCGPKKEVSHGLGPIKAGKYILDKYLPHLERLRDELESVNPNLIVALGGTASWALLGDSRISKIRGCIAGSNYVGGRKCLPTFHPAAILRQWELRAVTVLDLVKAKRQAEFPDIRRPERTVYTEPTLTDLEWFYETHIVGAKALAFDIETSGDIITCLGFAPSRQVSLVVPFMDTRRPGYAYWGDKHLELLAWKFVRRVLENPLPKIAQNGAYDLGFLWRRYGIKVVNFTEDTMLLHHSLQPESPKGLGFMGSVYTDEPAWKIMREGKEDETIKRDA